MERGKFTLTEYNATGAGRPAGGQKLPNIQKSGKLLRHFNMRHFWMIFWIKICPQWMAFTRH